MLQDCTNVLIAEKYCILAIKTPNQAFPFTMSGIKSLPLENHVLSTMKWGNRIVWFQNFMAELAARTTRWMGTPIKSFDDGNFNRWEEGRGSLPQGMMKLEERKRAGHRVLVYLRNQQLNIKYWHAYQKNDESQILPSFENSKINFLKYGPSYRSAKLHIYFLKEHRSACKSLCPL